MPIELEKVLAYKLGPLEGGWTEDQVILYQLGIGAGAACTDPKELEYVYEGNLKVLPTFSVIPVTNLIEQITNVPGLEFNPVLALHGEQEIEVFAPIPRRAKVVTTGRIAAVYDKRQAALLVLESETKDDKGELLFINRFGIFLRGEGGFGGPRGPSTEIRSPERAPDHVVESPTIPQQALLYRLSGDKNPLHADPEFAKFAGFERPILHGLCSYGIACKAVVDACLDGDVAKIAKFQARFRGVVFPGETIVTSIWKEGDQYVLSAQTKERQSPVLSNAAVTLRA